MVVLVLEMGALVSCVRFVVGSIGEVVVRWAGGTVVLWSVATVGASAAPVVVGAFAVLTRKGG